MPNFFPNYLTGLVAVVVFCLSVGVFYLVDHAIAPMRKKWHRLNFWRRVIVVAVEIIAAIPMVYISLILVMSIYGLGNTINVLIRGN